jgi:hypothetical protein
MLLPQRRQIEKLSIRVHFTSSIASAAPNKKPRVSASYRPSLGQRWTEQVSKNDEVTPPCRCVTLLRHAFGYETEMLAEHENSDHS